ncbi:MAG: hypothetical protein AB7F40_11550 [Victivallaceae bacterium]|nr:hypothetical protein [Victivallaceae bacterium]
MKKSIVILLLASLTAAAAPYHIDPLFGYYRNRSPESVASELQVNGVEEVWYFAVTPEACRRDLIDALHAHDIRVVLTLFPSWVYLNEKQLDHYLPANWRDWRMEFTNPVAKQDHIFIGYVYPEYNLWYRNYVVNLLKEYHFDGVAMIETMYPCYRGDRYKPILMGDVSKGFEKAFGEPLPEFLNDSSPRYFKTDTGRFERYLAFRTRTINDFYKYVMDGVRAECPGVTVVSWALGVSTPDGEAEIRRWNGSDTFSLVRAVKPDMHMVQTHWPDWSSPELKPDYILQYQPFAEAARRGCPGVRVSFQGDCGSLPEMRRSPEWVAENLALAAGVFDHSVYYEFSLRDEVYSLPPVLKKHSISGDSVILVFDQRLGADSVRAMLNRSDVKDAKADGNILTVAFENGPPPSLDIGGICDDPSSRLPLSRQAPKPYGRVNAIPAGTVVNIR